MPASVAPSLEAKGIVATQSSGPKEMGGNRADSAAGVFNPALARMSHASRVHTCSKKGDGGSGEKES